MATRTPLGTNGALGVTTLSVAISSAIDAAEMVEVGFVIGTTATAITVVCGADTFTINLSVTGSGRITKLASLLSSSAHAINTNVTISWTGADNCSMWVSKISVAATALDKTAGATGTGTAASSGATATTTQAAEWLWGAVGTESVSENFSAPGGGFTLGQVVNSATLVNVAELYQEVAATGAYTASCTILSATWEALIATYKEAAAAAGPARVPNVSSVPTLPTVGSPA